jgi:ankyrin repeat protein
MDLSRAAAAGDLEGIRAALRAGADVNAISFEYAPIHRAVRCRQYRAVELLLDRRACTEIWSIGLDWTPLHFAVFGSEQDIAALLLTRKASVNAIDHNGNTPLFFAADPGMFELLFQHGASLSVVSNENRTPFQVTDSDGKQYLKRLSKRVPRCLAAVVALFGCPMHHDIRNLLARLVWETRRDPVWDGAKKLCF